MELSFDPKKTLLGTYDSVRDTHLSGYWFERANYKPRRAATPGLHPIEKRLAIQDSPDISRQTTRSGVAGSRASQLQLTHSPYSAARLPLPLRKHSNTLTPTVPLVAGIPQEQIVHWLDVTTWVSGMTVNRTWYFVMRQALILYYGTPSSTSLEITDADVHSLRLLLKPPISYAHIVNQLDLHANHYNLSWVLNNERPPAVLTTLCTWLSACQAANLHPGTIGQEDNHQPTPVTITSPRSVIVCLKSGVHPVRDLVPYETTKFVKDERRKGKPTYAAELSFQEDAKSKKRLYQQICATYWALCDRYPREEICQRVDRRDDFTKSTAAIHLFDQNEHRLRILTERQQRKELLDQQKINMRKKQIEKIAARAAQVEKHQVNIAKKHKLELEAARHEAALRKAKLAEVAQAAKDRQEARRDQVEKEILRAEEKSRQKRDAETFARTIHSTLRISRQQMRRGDVQRQNNRVEYEKLRLLEHDCERRMNVEAFEDQVAKAVLDMKERRRELFQREPKKWDYSSKLSTKRKSHFLEEIKTPRPL